MSNRHCCCLLVTLPQLEHGVREINLTYTRRGGRLAMQYEVSVNVCSPTHAFPVMFDGVVCLPG
jgi:hypothetical protein